MSARIWRRAKCITQVRGMALLVDNDVRNLCPGSVARASCSLCGWLLEPPLQGERQERWTRATFEIFWKR
jgi:hypothetical protein